MRWNNLSLEELIKELQHELDECYIAPDQGGGYVVLEAEQLKHIIDRLRSGYHPKLKV